MPQTRLPRAESYERIVAEQSPDVLWGDFPENTACGLCYTSGTTGNPKGVLYSHRSNFLHTFMALQASVVGGKTSDVILPVVPMFHANAWGIAFVGPASGCKLVMPGARMDGEALYELLETEGVTFSAAVPTVWQGLLAHMRQNGLKLSTVKRVLIGGSAVPESLIRAFHDDYGVEVLQGWGMTETSPIGTLSNMTPETAALPFEEQLKYRTKQGTPPLGIELALKDDAGQSLPHDGATFGHLMVKGPTVARAYFREDASILDADGFFDTGDVATVDELGFMQITDRSKDVIKSGGEWISSIDLENCAVGCPGVAEAAVIGVPHPKWDERPLLIIVKKAGAELSADDVRAYLADKIAKWWMPDAIEFVDEIPHTATGKIQKTTLRERFASYKLALA
jgi:fatty-acyl-CoA synthase